MIQIRSREDKLWIVEVEARSPGHDCLLLLEWHGMAPHPPTCMASIPCRVASMHASVSLCNAPACMVPWLWLAPPAPQDKSTDEISSDLIHAHCRPPASQPPVALHFLSPPCMATIYSTLPFLLPLLITPARC